MTKDELSAYECCSMHDPTGRRGIWFRLPGGATNFNEIEICAGLEGDDYRLTLTAGQTLTTKDIFQLHSALDTGAWMLEDNPPGRDLWGRSPR